MSSNNRIDYWAPPLTWGQWYTSDAMIVLENGTYDLGMDFSTLSNAPSSFDVEVRYHNGTDWVVETYPITGSGGVNVTVGEGIHTAQFRLKSHSVGQIITVDPGILAFLPGVTDMGPGPVYDPNEQIADTPGDDEYEIYPVDDDGLNTHTVFNDGGGNNTITVKKGARVTVTNDKDPSSSNTIKLEGYNEDDITLVKDGNDLHIVDKTSGETILILKQHFDPTSGPGVARIEFVPDNDGIGGAGNPINFDSSNGEVEEPSNPLDQPSAQMNSLRKILDDYIQDALDKFEEAEDAASPLVLDLDGDGVELVALADSNIAWDIDEDGFAEASGWVAADDGLLAIDLDGDGMITQHSELFGDSVYADGFAALAVYDTNADNVIDANDAQFGDLLVWQDINQNGTSEAAELYALDDLDIISINLNAASVNQINAGHDVKLVSTYTMDDGISGPQTLDIVDVWFQYDNTNTTYVGDYTLDIGSLFLPTLRGYGDLPDLYISSSQDNDYGDSGSLTRLLTDFVFKNIDDLFVDDGSVLSDVRDIMFRWAGVDSVDPTSRGDFVDARELGFLEQLIGREFNPGADPAGGQGELLSEAFDIALQGIAPRLIAQAAGKDLFEGNVLYNPAADTFDGITGLNQNALDTLLTKAQDAVQVSDKVAFWGDVVRVVEEVVGVANLSTGDATALETAIMTSDSTLTTQLILDTLAWNSDLGEIINGTTGIDNLLGTIGDDTIYGGYGNDEILGGIGADTLRGGAHNDTLNGQSGDDVLYGESGNDTYLYIAGQGQDSVYEQNGTDNILFGPGISFSDLTLSRISNDALRIDVSEAVGGGRVTILNQFTASKVETLNFDDGSSIDLSTINHTLTGTAGADTLKGVRYGGGQDDTIYGLEGDDMIYGYNGVGDYGDNWLYGGAGSDTIYGAYGVDYIEGGTEDDHIRGYNGNDELHGGAGDDEILGGNNDDTLYGDAGADILKGENNNDTLIGGLGADELWSGNGYDTFTFLSSGSFDAVDTIKDLNTIYDVIDISNLLSAYDPLTDVITDFVQITDNGTDSTLAIDADGGADAFIAIATIAGKTGLTDEAALESSGLLIAA